ncbi:MAG: hypothetical protein VKJ06_06740 [Vampirovibrionales bacterium]|nr:hypothetical protein [Vampirovibrionales bacterium]
MVTLPDPWVGGIKASAEEKPPSGASSGVNYDTSPKPPPLLAPAPTRKALKPGWSPELFLPPWRYGNKSRAASQSQALRIIFKALAGPLRHPEYLNLPLSNHSFSIQRQPDLVHFRARRAPSSKVYQLQFRLGALDRALNEDIARYQSGFSLTVDEWILDPKKRPAAIAVGLLTALKTRRYDVFEWSIRLFLTYASEARHAQQKKVINAKIRRASLDATHPPVLKASGGLMPRLMPKNNTPPNNTP